MYSEEFQKIFTLRIARTKTGDLILVDCDEDTFEEGKEFSITDLIDGWGRLEESEHGLQGLELIPKERGLYECKLEYNSWRCWEGDYDCTEFITEVKPLFVDNQLEDN